MPESSDPLPSLDTLQREIERARPRQNAEESSAPGADMGRAMRLAIELVAGAVLGATLGYFTDRWLETSPLFLVVFFFLGVAGGFRNILRDMKKDSSDV